MKTPPHSLDAERAVLGCILLDTIGRSDDRVMDECRSRGVVAEAFYDPCNRLIYQTMLDMNRASKPLDALSLIEELRRVNRLEAAGGVGFIQSLIDQVPTTAHAEHYISIVKGKYLRRMMIERATKVVENSFDEEEYPDPQVVLGDAERTFLEIGGGGGATMPWASAVDDSFKRIDRLFEAGGRIMEGLSTGYKYLDETLQGLKPGEMIVIAARPSVGKTSLAMNIAESAALGQMISTGQKVPYDDGRQHPVAIFSLEMPVEQLTKRMLAGRAGINMWRLNRNLVSRNEKNAMTESLMKAMGELRNAPFYVDDTAGLDVMDLRARARRMKKQHGIELIERGDKYEKPKLSDLRDSGAIEQDADVVFLLRRPSRNSADPESNDPTLAYVDIAKNRNGETGELAMSFIREHTRFLDREPEHTAVENFQSSEQPPEQGEFAPDPMM